MQIEMTELEPCKFSVHYTADSEEILNKRSEVLQAFKTAPVKGFRQNKAPLEIVKRVYASQIDESLKRALLEDAYHNTIFEKKLKPHGAPMFNSSLLLDGVFSCDFTLLTKPDFNLPDFRSFNVPKPHENQTEVELSEKMLQDLRVRLGTVRPYDENDFVQSGDNVVINYDSFLDDKKLDNLCAEGEMLTIGNSKLNGFDDALLGMKIGESRSFEIVIPVNGLPSLVGKAIKFNTTLVMGSKTEPCPLDDELAQRLNKSSLAELRDFMRMSATSQLAQERKKSIIEAVSIKLVENTTVEVPNWMSLSEAQYLAQKSKLNWVEMSDEDKEMYLKQGEKNVKLALVLDKIREEEPEAQLTDQEVFDIIKGNLMRTKTESSINDVLMQMNSTGYLQILFSRIKDEYALDFVCKNVKIVE